MPELTKIRTKAEQERREQRTKRLFSLLIAAILIVSIAAFALTYYQQGRTGVQSYGDYEFVRSDRGWTTAAAGYSINTASLPQEVENISHSGLLSLNEFSSVVYFVALSSAELLGVGELDGLLQQVAERRQLACLPEDADLEACAELPLHNCSDAGWGQAVIIFKEANATINASVSYSNNCLTITGSADGLVKAADKVIFMLVGIIKQ